MSPASKYNRPWVAFSFQRQLWRQPLFIRAGHASDGQKNKQQRSPKPKMSYPSGRILSRESLLRGWGTREERDMVKIKLWKWCMRLQSGSHATRRSQAVLLKAVLMKSAEESHPDLIDSRGNKSRLSWQICACTILFCFLVLVLKRAIKQAPASGRRAPFRASRRSQDAAELMDVVSLAVCSR